MTSPPPKTTMPVEADKPSNDEAKMKTEAADEKQTDDGSANDACCEKCGRDKLTVAIQEDDPSLLPYLECATCSLPMYYTPNKDYVEYEKREGEIVLITDCFCGDWDAALQRVRLFPKEAATVPRSEKAESALHWACYNGAPPNVIRAIAAAAPKMVSYHAGWHSQGYPLDCILNAYMKPEDLDKIKALLEANMDAADLSLGTAWYRIGGVIRKSLELFPDDFPQDGPFSFLEDHRDERVRNYTPLTPSQQYQVLWEIFCLMNRVSYHESFDGSQFLVHALANCRTLYYAEEDCGFGSFECPDAALQFAIKMYPQELNQADEDGNLPLHLAIKSIEPERKKNPWEDDFFDIASYEEPEETVENPYSNYNVDKIEILAEAYPAAIQMENGAGELPLHLAIKARKSWKTIQAILGVDSDAIKQVDKEGNSCLALAALSSLPVKSKKEWHYPESSQDSDDDSDLGMYEDPYYTLNITTDVNMIERLINVYPTALQMPNHHGSLPLHLSIESGKDWEDGIEIFFAAHPDAAREPDNAGLYPFMIAALHCPASSTVDVTYRLLREWPVALKDFCAPPEMVCEKTEAKQEEQQSPKKKRKLKG